MQPSQYLNLVSWTPYAEEGGTGALDVTRRVFLALEGEWVITAGLDADVNSGRVPYTEFERVLDRFGRDGMVEFWQTVDPREDSGGQPDVSRDGVRLVNYEPLQVGKVYGEETVRVIEMRLFFADFRADIAPPRGGRLRRGKMNPLPPPIDPKTQKPQEPVSNVDLLRICLEATGLDYVLDPAPIEQLSKVPPAHDLEWYGSHCGEELKKLLEYVGAVALPASDRSLAVEMLGDGTEPEIPAGQALPEIRLPGVDRRGKTVVFTSIPKTAMKTLTTELETLPKLRFVAQDPGDHDKWVELKKLAGVSDDSAVATALNQGFKDVKDQKVRTRLLDQAFRCIQFDPEDKESPKGTILRQAFRTDKTLDPIEVQARAAALTADGLWKDPEDDDDFAPVAAPHLFADVGVVVLACRLVRVGKEATGNPDALAKPLDLTKDLRLKLTVQENEEDPADPNMRRPKYFACGYIKNAGQAELTQLTQEEAEGAVDAPDPDTVLIDDPTLVLVTEQGKEEDQDNRQELEDRCKTLAERYLAGSGDEYRILRGAGFIPGELSGKVHEIRYSQRELMTTFKVNSWWRPHEAVTEDRLKEIAAGGTGGAFPKQAATEGARLAGGLSGGVQPVVPVHTPMAEMPSIRNATFVVKEDEGKIKTLSGDAEWDKPSEQAAPVAYFDEKGNFQLLAASSLAICRLNKTNGDDAGSLTTLPDYVYTATDPLTGDTLGTDLSPLTRAFTAGTFSPADWGLGYKTPGGFVLVYAIEKRRVGGCT